MSLFINLLTAIFIFSIISGAFNVNLLFEPFIYLF